MLLIKKIICFAVVPVSLEQIPAMKYCKHIIFSVYDIWRTFNFLLFSLDYIWWLIETHLLSLYKWTFSDVHDLAEGLNRQRAKKNI